MEFKDVLKTKIREEVERTFGSSVNAFAKTIGVQQPSLSRFLAGGQDSLHFDAVQKILSYIGGELSFETTRSHEYAFIRRVEARPSAGGGSLETSDGVHSRIAFRVDWLVSRTTTSPEQISAMVVPSDSMLPTFGTGDIILVDEGDAGRELIDGKIFVVRVGEEIYVKRYRKGVGKMLFLSDNQEMRYQDFEVSHGDPDGFHIYGRVFWTGREL